jgi:hypothetical protein
LRAPPRCRSIGGRRLPGTAACSGSQEPTAERMVSDAGAGDSVTRVAEEARALLPALAGSPSEPRGGRCDPSAPDNQREGHAATVDHRAGRGAGDAVQDPGGENHQPGAAGLADGPGLAGPALGTIPRAVAAPRPPGDQPADPMRAWAVPMRDGRRRAAGAGPIVRAFVGTRTLWCLADA